MPERESLAADWKDLLGRRPQYRDTLRLYHAVIDAWDRWTSVDVPVLRWSAEECRQRWERGVPLIAEALPAFERGAIEPLIEPVLEELAAIGEEEAEALDRFARAWYEGRIVPADLLRGRLGDSGRTAAAALGIPADLLGLLTYLGLRPALEAYFSQARSAFTAGLWDGGGCPFCALPPSFADIGDAGKRWLYCALCGGRWTVGRLRCPFCDNRDARTLTRLSAEGGEEGYLIEACDLCRGYLKGVDRRLRWNVGSPLIEDWGTPHLDLIAQRKGYWRATPSLVQLAPLA